MDDQREAHRTLDHAVGERYSYEFASSVEQAREHSETAIYPLGLSGEGIPLEGRIVAVVDVFDALLSDPQIVDALLNHLDEALRLRSVHP